MIPLGEEAPSVTPTDDADSLRPIVFEIPNTAQNILTRYFFGFWATGFRYPLKKTKTGEGIRTLHPNLGKVVLTMTAIRERCFHRLEWRLRPAPCKVRRLEEAVGADQLPAMLAIHLDRVIAGEVS